MLYWPLANGATGWTCQTDRLLVPASMNTAAVDAQDEATRFCSRRIGNWIE